MAVKFSGKHPDFKGNGEGKDVRNGKAKKTSVKGGKSSGIGKDAKVHSKGTPKSVKVGKK